MRRRKYEENENDANMCAFDLSTSTLHNIRVMCIQVLCPQCSLQLNMLLVNKTVGSI